MYIYIAQNNYTAIEFNNHITDKWEENEARKVTRKSFVCMSKSRPRPENERQLSTGLGVITQANKLVQTSWATAPTMMVVIATCTRDPLYSNSKATVDSSITLHQGWNSSRQCWNSSRHGWNNNHQWLE